MISGVIFTALRSLVNDRCYPSKFEQPDGTLPPWPAIRYTVVNANNVPTICGTDDVDTDDTTVQIDVVAKTHGGMVTVRDQVITAMQATYPPCIRDSVFETWDTETKTHRCVLTYTFYASSAAGSP